MSVFVLLVMCAEANCAAIAAAGAIAPLVDMLKRSQSDAVRSMAADALFNLAFTGAPAGRAGPLRDSTRCMCHKYIFVFVLPVVEYGGIVRRLACTFMLASCTILPCRKRADCV